MNGIRETVELTSWTDFEPALQKIRRKHAECFRKGAGEEDYQHTSPMLFRGQSNAEWGLLTTLERRTKEEFSIQEYCEAAARYASEIEAYTEKRWDRTSYSEIKKFFEHQDELHARLPCYAYLVYLRQHGFPSPLLDWTRSPYIAAFFAFEAAYSSDRVAVFTYVEVPGIGKAFTAGKPCIRTRGPFARTHSRHFAQQSEYTIATKWENNTHVFCRHEEAFSNQPEIVDQDVLVKITLPSACRWDAMSYLSDHNINHHTLFQDESALIASMGLREFDVRRPGFNRFRATTVAGLPPPKRMHPG